MSMHDRTKKETNQIKRGSTANNNNRNRDPSNGTELGGSRRAKNATATCIK